MKVIRAVALLLIVITALSGLCSCNNEEVLTVKDISKQLYELCLSNSETYEVKKADIENRFNFDGNLLNEYSVQLCDTEEKYLCVAVFSLKDKDSRQIVIDGISSSLKVTAKSFGVLHNSEYEKIQHRLFYEYSDIIIFVVADNYTTCEKYLKDIGASPIA